MKKLWRALFWAEALCWPILVFYGSVVLSIAVFLMSVQQPPYAVVGVFQVANEQKRLLDVMMILVPLGFLYPVIGIQAAGSAFRSGIEHAERFVFWFIALPSVVFLSFNLLVAFYLAKLHGELFSSDDFAMAIAASIASFGALLWFEFGATVSRLAERSRQPEVNAK